MRVAKKQERLARLAGFAFANTHRVSWKLLHLRPGARGQRYEVDHLPDKRGVRVTRDCVTDRLELVTEEENKAREAARRAKLAESRSLARTLKRVADARRKAGFGTRKVTAA